MPKYFVYRYIDKKTTEIVYIGKCGRMLLEDRIKEHKDDEIGKWIKKNEYEIEFIELPREEDMNYLESYLIREHSPKCNILLKEKTKPPFSIKIDNDCWKNYFDYLEKKKQLSHIIQTKSEDNIKNNILEIAKSNKEFEHNLWELIHFMNEEDTSFINFLLKLSGENQTYVISINTFAFLYDVGKFKRVEILKSIRKRLLNYRFYGRMKGTVNTEDWVKLFEDIKFTENDTVQFTFGHNHKYITKILQNT